MIDDGEKGTVSTIAKRPQETGNLSASEDMGQRFVALDVDLFPDVPVEPDMVAVESAQRTNGLVKRAGTELALVLQVDEEVEHALGSERGKVFLREVSGKLADPAVVGQSAAFGEPFELDEAGEILIPNGRSDCVIFFS